MPLHLIRHGEVENPDRLVYADMPGFGLSERGRAEAAAAAEFLATIPITALCSSPLQRAQETAAVIAERCGVEIVTVDDLTEWLLARRWKGVPWDDLPAVFPGEVEAYLEHPTDLPFAEESIEALGRRVAAAVAAVAADHPGEHVAIVSHQDPIQAGRLILRDLPLTELHLERPGHCHVLTLLPGEPWVETGYWVPEVGGPLPPAWPPVARP
jgi:broad specificity phosphatase PhoE